VDLTLELDAINANPCMKMILQVVNELHTSITPPPAEMTKEDGQMPSWMKDIHRKLINPSKCQGRISRVVLRSVKLGLFNRSIFRIQIFAIDTHLNVRLLLAKLIVNMPQAFEVYANSWVRPLMRLVIEGESYGDAMSYFVQVN
jgi:DNA-dependent protein kinase catalytic subunit